MNEPRGARIHITGIVQGVGFRPFVYSLATRLSITGWVRNTSAGVEIEVDGTPEALDAFVHALREEAPPLARIDEFHVQDQPANGFSDFEIIHSEAIPDAFQPISPDVSLCADCLRELLDPNDRRYRYPFLNCTNCGPRFTIIKDIPYDRPQTTMAPFEMCADCASEYENPLDRRFHAQPVACPECGPHISLEVDGKTVAEREEALQAARRVLKEGRVLAVRGLGGFHLACDATNPDAVATLRRRKLRVDKPFALMMPDLETVEAHCLLDDVERELLQSHQRPIVILMRREESDVTHEVAPGQDTLGVMLPYTPLHILLIEPEEDFPPALVMTSGNLSEEPIATENEEARERLDDLADAFLLHDRRIQTRCDDAVVRTFDGAVYPLRRSRGYAPFPVHLPWKLPPILAVGGELKNTYCLTRGSYAFLSHHIGDMENYETLCAFEDGVDHYERLFRVQPEIMAYDLHPDYMATRYALARAEQEGLSAEGVQHHHAHIAACMAEHGIPDGESVIGVSFDGTGYGEDGAIWGGEFLLTDYRRFERPYHLAYVPLLGGEAAVRQPWRLALAWLFQADLEADEDLAVIETAGPEARELLKRMYDGRINAPLTSSMGRLFDAVSSLANVRHEVNYEAQAAIELEALVDPDENGVYRFMFADENIDPVPMFREIVGDLRAGVSVPKIAARFHNGVAHMVDQVCRAIRDQSGIEEVALSGGVWQNMVLLSRTVRLLRQSGFEVYLHRQVPANDGGLSLGQAVVAAHRLALSHQPSAFSRGSRLADR
ncbi:MAG: carbamoyltransferase HypF [Anaerolineaceae bacterium]|nr:MAG: carbamoyltransferase HypF [Anaerolineaceae bacterium]